MISQTHNPRGGKSSVVALAMLGAVLIPCGPLAAQNSIQPIWPAPPPAVWVSPPAVPQPASIVPGQTVTTYFPPVVSEEPAEQLAIAPPDGAHLRVTVAESLISDLLERDVTDSGPIRDCLLGASLFGNQFTVTHLSVDSQPCPDHARFLLRLQGSVTDQTVGVTRPAAVRSEGIHTFEMTKQVDFDGRRFTTRTPSAWVAPSINYRGATTIVSGVPVIGRIGSAIALNEAERRRPAAMQFALRRVTEMAAPRFNREVDRKLSAANRRLSARRPPFFERWKLSILNETLMTSDHCLHYCLTLPAVSEETLKIPAPVPESDSESESPPLELEGPAFLGELEAVSPVSLEGPEFGQETIHQRSSPAAPLTEDAMLTIVVHEAFVNHVLGCLELGKREVPDRLIDKLLEVLLEVVGRMSFEGTSFDLGELEPEYATLLLDENRPAAIRFGDGEAMVTLRTGFRVLAGQELPTQLLEIPFTMTEESEQITLEPGEVRVEAAAPDEDSPFIALARPVIREHVEESLQPIVITRTVPVSLPGMKPVTLNVRDVVIKDGWLTITLD